MWENLNKKSLDKICEDGRRSFAILKDIVIEQDKKIKELQEHIEKLNKELAKATSTNKSSDEKVVEGKEEDRFCLMRNSHGYFVFDKGYANYGATNGVLGDCYEEKDFLKDVVDKLNERVSWDDKRDLSKPSELINIVLGDKEAALAGSLLMGKILEDILCRL